MAFYLVMPRSIGGTGFHGREDMDQTGVISPLGDERLDPVLFTKRLVAADGLDLITRLRGELFGMAAQFIPQRLRPARVVEQSNVVITEVARHGASITNIGKGPGDDDTIETGEHARDFIPVALDEWIHDGYPLFLQLRIRIAETTNFGSGYAGLGLRCVGCILQKITSPMLLQAVCGQFFIST